MVPTASACHRIPVQINPLASLISELSVWYLAVRMYTGLRTPMFELHTDAASLIQPMSQVPVHLPRYQAYASIPDFRPIP